MSENLQIIPEGLLGFKYTPMNVTVITDAADYDVNNGDQILVNDGGADIYFDSTTLDNGKFFIIKNISGSQITIDAGTATFDGSATIDFANNSIMFCVLCKLELGDIFYIVYTSNPA